MKTLILVRHAKSSWDAPGMTDLERPLNERGKKDAPEMAVRLKEKGIRLDQVVSSPAKRAKKTARYFAEEFNLEKNMILLSDQLYDALPDAFSKTVEGLQDPYHTVALFSHNPGITEYVAGLTNVRVDDMPTCAMFGVQADVENWSEFGKAEKKFLFFDYPKNPLP